MLAEKIQRDRAVEHGRGVVWGVGFERGDLERIAAALRRRAQPREDLGDMPDAFEERIGGKPGFRALPPEQIPADTYAGGFIAYEIPWLYLSWGTITVQGYWENGMYSRTESTTTYFYGPGGGFRLYLKKIAIPAVGIDATYNFEERSLEMSAAVGFRM